MRVAIIGLGYWGNIILRNLENLGIEDIIICDSSIKNTREYQRYPTVNKYQDLDCDSVFIITPTSTHYEISKHFLEREVNTFCEKPLTTSSLEAEKLYKIAFEKRVILFTNWIFTFNSHIETIKRDYESRKLGKINSIFMNRLNLGPERHDVNARWDLASHDVSIIQYLFSEIPKNVRWTDYKRDNNSDQEDSSLGLLEYNDFVASINVSWHYRKKVRECVFEFDKFFVVWDDYKRVLEYENSQNLSYPIYSGNLSYPCAYYQEPLKNAIKSFFSFSIEDMKLQKKLTIDTINILEK
ncbi:MAG: Gfo/Idh/MocA family protein [Promethearchaeota archaeon]